MTDIIDIEEHDVLENPVIKEMFPNISDIKHEVDDILDNLTQISEPSQKQEIRLAEPDSTTIILSTTESVATVSSNSVIHNNGNVEAVTTNSKQRPIKTNAIHTVCDSDKNQMLIESKNKRPGVTKADSTVKLNVPMYCSSRSLLKHQFRQMTVKKTAEKDKHKTKTEHIPTKAEKYFYCDCKKEVNKQINVLIRRSERFTGYIRNSRISPTEMKKIISAKVSITDVGTDFKDSYCVDCERLFFVKEDFLRHMNEEHNNIKDYTIKKNESPIEKVPINTGVSCVGLRKGDKVKEVAYGHTWHNENLRKDPDLITIAPLLYSRKYVVEETSKDFHSVPKNAIESGDYERKSMNGKKKLRDFIKDSYMQHVGDISIKKYPHSDLKDVKRIDALKKHYTLNTIARSPYTKTHVAEHTTAAVPDDAASITRIKNISSSPANATRKSTKERQTVCLHCNKNFGSTENLIKHMYYVLPKKNLETKTNLTEQRRQQNIEQRKVNRKEKPFEVHSKDATVDYFNCRMCAKKFTTKQHLSAHYSRNRCPKKAGDRQTDRKTSSAINQQSVPKSATETGHAMEDKTRSKDGAVGGYVVKSIKMMTPINDTSYDFVDVNFNSETKGDSVSSINRLHPRKTNNSPQINPGTRKICTTDVSGLAMSNSRLNRTDSLVAISDDELETSGRDKNEEEMKDTTRKIKKVVNKKPKRRKRVKKMDPQLDISKSLPKKTDDSIDSAESLRLEVNYATSKVPCKIRRISGPVDEVCIDDKQSLAPYNHEQIKYIRSTARVTAAKENLNTLKDDDQSSPDKSGTFIDICEHIDGSHHDPNKIHCNEAINYDTSFQTIRNPEELLKLNVPTKRVGLNNFAEDIIDVKSKGEIKISVILDDTDEEQSDTQDRFDRNVNEDSSKSYAMLRNEIEDMTQKEDSSISQQRNNENNQNATENYLVPNSIIFKCQKCPLNFVKCSTAYEHFSKYCAKDLGTYPGKIVDCKHCCRTLLEDDIQLHEKQHIMAKDLEVITVKDDTIFQKLLFYCSKCGVNFAEKKFYEHKCEIDQENSIYCKQCDAILDVDLKDHTMWHSSFETDEFVVVYFDNPDEMFWRNN